jgi:hypothetical protein
MSHLLLSITLSIEIGDEVATDSVIQLIRRRMEEFVGDKKPTIGEVKWQRDMYPHLKKHPEIVLPGKPMDTVPLLCKQYNLTLKKSKWGWRSVKGKPVGEIVGLPTLRGELVITDGVIGLMILSNNRWAEVHLNSFIPDDDVEGEEEVGPLRLKPRVDRDTTKKVTKLQKDLASLVTIFESPDEFGMIISERGSLGVYRNETLDIRKQVLKKVKEAKESIENEPEVMWEKKVKTYEGN